MFIVHEVAALSGKIKESKDLIDKTEKNIHGLGGSNQYVAFGHILVVKNIILYFMTHEHIQKMHQST